MSYMSSYIRLVTYDAVNKLNHVPAKVRVSFRIRGEHFQPVALTDNQTRTFLSKVKAEFGEQRVAIVRSRYALVVKIY